MEQFLHSFKLLSLSILVGCLTACGGGDQDLAKFKEEYVNPPTEPTSPTKPVEPVPTPSNFLTDARTGFLTGTMGVTPIRVNREEPRSKITVEDAANTKVLVFMHGKDGATTQHSCPDTEYPQIPDTFNNLRYSGGKIKILYVCSLAVDREGERYSAEYVFGRVKEFKEIVKELQDAGVPNKNIFLTGHSAGGWSALMTAAEIGSDQVGGVIAFAPAFAGTRLQQGNSGATQAIRASQQQTMISQNQIHALVFAYEDDEFEIPSTLQFLKDAFPSQVNLVAQNCGLGHSTAFNDCNFYDNLTLINDFIK